MRETLEQVMALQPLWTSTNTEDMARRGRFVRHDGPNWLRENLLELEASHGRPFLHLAAGGRDGTGPKSEIPWIRLFSKNYSPANESTEPSSWVSSIVIGLPAASVVRPRTATRSFSRTRS